MGRPSRAARASASAGTVLTASATPSPMTCSRSSGIARCSWRSAATALVGTITASARRAARSPICRCHRAPCGVRVCGWVHGTASWIVTTSPTPSRRGGTSSVGACTTPTPLGAGPWPRGQAAASPRRGSGNRMGPTTPGTAAPSASRLPRQAHQLMTTSPGRAVRASAAASSAEYRPVPPGTGASICSTRNPIRTEQHPCAVIAGVNRYGSRQGAEPVSGRRRGDATGRGQPGGAPGRAPARTNRRINRKSSCHGVVSAATGVRRAARMAG